MAPCSLYHLHVSLGVLLVRYSTLASLLRETCCYTASHLPLGVTNKESCHSVSHYCYPTRSDLQGGVHLVRECPTEAIRYAEVHPSSSTVRPSANLNPKYKGTLDPCPL